jgi:hypothetical protein
MGPPEVGIAKNGNSFLDKLNKYEKKRIFKPPNEIRMASDTDI